MYLLDKKKNHYKGVWKGFLSLFAERSKREVFLKGPRSKQLYDRLILGIQTAQALLIHHLKVQIFLYFLPNIQGRGITRKWLCPFQLKTILFGEVIFIIMSRHTPFRELWESLTTDRSICIRDSRWMSYETAAILNQNHAYISHIIG